jgi:hypothetical protein
MGYEWSFAPEERKMTDRVWPAWMLTAFATLSIVAGVPVSAGEADAVKAQARLEANGTWRFDVTVRHADAGWDHYADRWDVVGPDGNVIASRKLLHPHDNEQPFTRSLSGVAIPGAVTVVTIRVHDSIHGLGGRQLTVPLNR